ncbi:MAG TPA: TIGR01777 family oxidoreductase [Candidatus Dormibacteraeota bacterium]|nr:TIGR01777 family oxidoreductase [Candidatus Dormibacteraeota bacterium]
MKVLMTGSTGFVGTALCRDLQSAGHTVCRLVRPGTAAEQRRDADGFDVNWNPLSGELGGAAVGAEAVVNLAGASIADGRWTAQRKELLLASRVDTTRALVRALSQMAARPRVLVSASGIGYYGNCGDQVLTEESPLGHDFLSRLGQEWEAEAAKAEALGIRVVRARFGIILAKHGGALPRMVRPFLWGAGGYIGSGEQWMSWVTLQDVVGILRFALENGAVRGPINVVSPQPLRNAEFTKVLAKSLRRPAIFPAPAFALRLLLGEMADELLLASQRAIPAQLEKLGYRFLHPDLPGALAVVWETA